MESDEFAFQLEQQKIEEERLAKREVGGSNTYTDPSDGTVYEWDASKRAWFPKIDDTFLAMYQASYGVDQQPTSTDQPSDQSINQPAELLSGLIGNQTSSQADNQSSDPTDKQPTPTKSPVAVLTTSNNEGEGTANESSSSNSNGKPATTPQKRKPEAGWFEMDSNLNTHVYVNGLPLDITEEEFVELMSKYGIIKENEDSGESKVKLYKDGQGQLKGDGLCCYLKRESVDLAIQLLHDSVYRGCRVYVEPAHFELKGKYRPELKKKKPSQGKKKKDQQQKLLGWKEHVGPKRSKYDKVVVLENMFDPVEFEGNPASLQDIKDDVREECEKYGDVRKLMVFDRNPKGVISVGFKDFESADLCIQAMQGRYFGGKVIKAHSWDGETSYHIEESEEEKRKRLKDWEKYLEEDEKY
jgi:RNA recognition motif-containing protein